MKAFLTACDIFLQNRPDIVVTYGGDPVSIAVQQLAKRQGAKVVFWLHNFGYSDRTGVRRGRLHHRAQRVLKAVLPGAARPAMQRAAECRALERSVSARRGIEK